jgi:hypothetical protein
LERFRRPEVEHGQAPSGSHSGCSGEQGKGTRGPGEFRHFIECGCGLGVLTVRRECQPMVCQSVNEGVARALPRLACRSARN